MSVFSEKHIWKLFEAYFRSNSLVNNQIDSFNDFVNFGMQEIVDQESTITLPNYTAKFNHITLATPQVIEEDRSLQFAWPNDARKRDLNYDSAILCNITETYIEGGENKKITHDRIVIGRMPVMLRSSICNLNNKDNEECPNDPGGYFIIKGHERVLVGQMRTVYNQVFVLRQKSGGKYKWIAETRSMSDETGHSVLLQAMIGVDDRTISFSLPYIKEPIPVGVVFKALGYREEDIINFIGMDSMRTSKYIRFILRDSFFCESQNDAIEYIGKYTIHVIDTDKKKDYALQVVETEMLPHLGIAGSVAEQACFLGRMVRRLIMTHIGERSEDDRDNYTNKRVETAGILLYDIFRNLFKKYIQFIKAQLEKRKQRPDIISIISRIKTITKGLHQCISTGNWGVQKNASYIRTGVSQVLDRMTYCASLSHLRRVIIPTGKDGKNTAMRQIHGSSFGFICPCECFDPKTPILLWNGNIKFAKDIVVGDFLIGDDGNCKRVYDTCFGFSEMYKIRHMRKGFINYTVTNNHILTLVNQKKEIFDITIRDYLRLPLDIKKTLKVFKSAGINWPARDEKLDYYMIGSNIGSHIPKEYIVNSRENRLRLLAGIIDTHGSLYKNRKIHIYHGPMNDYLFLVRSLGFSCYVSKNRLIITGGNGLHEIPTKLKLTKIQDDFSLYSSFSLISKPIREFVGWQLEGNGRFLLGDCTVTHNTPEGQKIGVVLNYALLTKITKKIPKVDVKSILELCKTILPVENMKFMNIKNSTAIFLNGGIIGFTEDHEETIKELRNKRSQRLLDYDVSLSYDAVDNDIRIFCDEGRFSRPLLTLTENHLNIQGEEKYKWNSLIRKGIVQYVDAAEIENCVIAMTHRDLKIQYNDFCEIHPSVMLGIMAAMIPFSDHSQSPRNCYQCLWLEEKITMADGTFTRIADIRVGDEIITVNPVTCEQTITKVINQYVRKTDKLIVKVRTLSGREVVCTADHPILTSNGWREACELTRMDKICVFPNQKSEEYFRVKETVDLIETRNMAIFVPVKYVISVENVVIADITTDSECHSFITEQGICVHNSSMGKQALGIPVLSYNLRTDTILHVLHYPQRPLVCTKMAEIFGINDMPSGINAIVAIAAYSGFNQEDSVILSLSAIQRGLFCLTSYHTIDCSEKKRDTYSFEEICVPPHNSDQNIKKGHENYFRRKNANYSLLDEQGIIRPRERFENGQWIGPATVVKKGDVLIGKVVVLAGKSSEESKTDASVVVQPGEEGVIDRIHIMVTPNGYKLVKIVIRVTREPTLGDKLACYDPETDVITSEGWVSIANVTTKHKVGCLIDGKKLEYINPIRVQEYDYEGKLYTVQNNVKVTPDHRMYVGDCHGNNFKLKQAYQIYGKKNSYKNNIDERQGKNEPFVLPGKYGLPDLIIPLNEWCVFFGIWTVNGFRIKEKLKFDIRLISYLKSIDKYLPQWCFELDMKNTRYLIHGMTGLETIYYTSSINLRDDFQRLCLHAGWGCTYTSKGDYWALTICKTHFLNKSDSWEDYKGKVYCCTVPTEDGLIFVRRGGKGYWCGNSRAAQKGTIGMVYNHEDMPFTSQGITPDIIINPLCLGSDTDITLRCKSSEKIDRIVQDIAAYQVETICPNEFTQEYTGITDPLVSKSSGRKMVHVQTWSGRSIICTDDHPFLVDKNYWKKATDLQPNRDMLTILHSTKKLSEKGEVPSHLDEKKLQIIARIFGAMEARGYLIFCNDKILRARLYLREERDVNDLLEDIHSIGLSGHIITKKENCYCVDIPQKLGLILYQLGAHSGRKSCVIKKFPNWLNTASSEVQRQFLCGFQGSIGSYISVNEKIIQEQVRIKPTKQLTDNKVLKSHKKYMTDISILFSKMGIISRVWVSYTKNVDTKNVILDILAMQQNIERYSDVIDYAYCHYKQRESRLPIEFLRLRNRGVRISFEKMKEFQRKDTIAVYVDKIENINYTGNVYDFATISSNHSFVANSIVVHNCIPSRMTINQLIECAIGKECTISGTYEDSTPFTAASINAANKLVDRASEKLQNYGFQAQGWETMYNGMTGEMIEARIFIGPTYYQRLKHMVDDKMHARAQGPVTMLCRQPSEGRSRDGGLRFGEMERDAVIAHGNSAMLKERLFQVSDPFQISVCKKCGVMTTSIKECHICKGDQVLSCNFPYASKLLHQELTTLGLKVTIRPGEK